MKQNMINNLLYTSINQRRIVIECRSGFLCSSNFSHIYIQLKASNQHMLKWHIWWCGACIHDKYHGVLIFHLGRSIPVSYTDILILVTWSIWKHHNAGVFNGVAASTPDCQGWGWTLVQDGGARIGPPAAVLECPVVGCLCYIQWRWSIF